MIYFDRGLLFHRHFWSGTLGLFAVRLPFLVVRRSIDLFRSITGFFHRHILVGTLDSLSQDSFPRDSGVSRSVSIENCFFSPSHLVGTLDSLSQDSFPRGSEGPSIRLDWILLFGACVRSPRVRHRPLLHDSHLVWLALWGVIVVSSFSSCC